MSKPAVYLTGPYTKGDIGENVRNACEVWEHFRSEGVVIPVCPHWSHLQQMIYPLNWEQWMDYDIDMIEAGMFDAVYKIPSDVPSVGSDREIQRAVELGIPVFEDAESLYAWAESR